MMYSESLQTECTACAISSRLSKQLLFSIEINLFFGDGFNSTFLLPRAPKSFLYNFISFTSIGLTALLLESHSRALDVYDGLFSPNRFAVSDCNSDHQLLVIALKFRLKKLMKPPTVLRFDYTTIIDDYRVEISNRFESLLQYDDEKTPNEL